MKNRPGKFGFGGAALGAASLVLCLASAPAFAQHRDLSAAELLSSSDVGGNTPAFTPFPLIHSSALGGLSFDLGDSEQQKLQLRLAEPLLIGGAVESRWLDLAGSEVTAGGSVDWLATDRLGLDVSAAQTERRPFQSLGSIHCENGVLAADSYTASGCYFVDQPGAPDLSTVSLGARYDLGRQASTALRLFRQELNVGSSARGPEAAGQAMPFAGLPGTLPQSSPLPASLAGQPLDYLQAEVTGIDLEFKVGVSTDRAGEMRLGLQLTRILDGSYDGQTLDGGGLQDWTLSGPSDSARLSFDWRKGSFSGGVQSFYRAPVEFMNRSELGSMTTFDVHFTWRTPWNANLSVGASNLLNAGSEETGAADTVLSDPFESVYGRIPYVRYQQDL